MDTRLAIPLILLAGALTLASGVERSLVSEFAPFRVEGGELATMLAIGGLPGLEPRLAWTDPPAAARHFVIVGENLDAVQGEAIFWVEREATGARHFEAPGLEALAGRRLRVSVHALAAPLDLPAGADLEDVAREASARALSSATWFAGAGWLEPASFR
jgi:phosphatidylethanolamine-binding protein (PEBP) family uncharacterized protein